MAGLKQNAKTLLVRAAASVGSKAEWTREDDQASKKQGWIISDCSGDPTHPAFELEALDEDLDSEEPMAPMPFEGDGRDFLAHAHVRALFEQGDALAIKAHAFLAVHSPEEFATVFGEGRET